MKKKQNNMFDQTICFANLLSAYKKAVRRCRKTDEINKFTFYLEKELIQLKKELSSETYVPAPHRYFTVFDPKKRTIAVAPFQDRIVHHAIVNILEPIFEKRFIFDSYASRKNKGTHAAVKRAQKFIRKRPWYLKADIQKHFDSIDHKILLKQIKMKIKDERLFSLIEKIVHRPDLPLKGLPIGNLTSQFFANLYLDIFDHYIKDQLGIKCYLRYMDDFVIFGWSQKMVKERHDKADLFLKKNLKLSLNKKVSYLGKSITGLSFLGMRIYPGTIRVKSENKKRSIKRIYKNHQLWETGKVHEDALVSSVKSVMAHLTYFANVRCEQI